MPPTVISNAQCPSGKYHAPQDTKIHLNNPHLTITDANSTMLTSWHGHREVPSLKRTLLPLSRCPFPIKGSSNCALALYFSDNNAINTHYCTTPNTVSKNSITQLCPNHYPMTAIQASSIEHICPSYIDTKNNNPQLVLITILEGFPILTPDFIKPAVNFFTSKMSIALWEYQFDHLMNLSNP